MILKKEWQKVVSGTQSNLKPRKTFRKSHKNDKISVYKIVVRNPNDMGNGNTKILSIRVCKYLLLERS